MKKLIIKILKNIMIPFLIVFAFCLLFFVINLKTISSGSMTVAFVASFVSAIILSLVYFIIRYMMKNGAWRKFLIPFISIFLLTFILLFINVSYLYFLNLLAILAVSFMAATTITFLIYVLLIITKKSNKS